MNKILAIKFLFPRIEYSVTRVIKEFIVVPFAPLYTQSWSASSYSIKARKHFRFSLQDVTEHASVDVRGRAIPWSGSLLRFPPFLLPLPFGCEVFGRGNGGAILDLLCCGTIDSEIEERLVRPAPAFNCLLWACARLEGVDKLLADEDVCTRFLPQWRRYSGSLK